MDPLVRLVGRLLSGLHAAAPVEACPGGWAWTVTAAGGLLALLPALGAVLVAALRRWTGNRYGAGGLLAVTAIGFGTVGLLPWLGFFATSEVLRGAQRGEAAAVGLRRADLASLATDHCFAPAQVEYLGGARTVRQVLGELPAGRPAVLAGAVLLLVVVPLLAMLLVYGQCRLATRRGPRWPARLLWLPVLVPVAATVPLSSTVVAHLWLGFLPVALLGMLPVALVGPPRWSVIEGRAGSALPAATLAPLPPAGPAWSPAPGPQFGTAQLSNPLAGGLQLSGPQLSRPQANKPQVNGPQVRGPQLGGPQFGGPQFGEVPFDGPRSSRTPHVNGPQPGTPQLGGSRYGAGQLGSPPAGGPQQRDPRYGDVRHGGAPHRPPPRLPTLPLPPDTAPGLPGRVATGPAASDQPPAQPGGGPAGAPAAPASEQLPRTGRQLAADPGPLPETLQRALAPSAAPAPRLEPPTLPPSRFQRIRPLGSGGFSTVWLAADTVLGRTVAVKAARAVDVQAERRIRREARALAAVDHPHCVRIYDILTDADGELVIVMEHVPGRSLSAAVEAGGPLPDSAGARLWITLAGALHAAHGKGVLHRDVKPANVVIDEDGFPHLIDFGIARTSGDVTLTAAGMVVGTPDYLAPEVAAGKPASPASDIWQLAATVSYALAGQPPRAHRDGAVAALLAAAQGQPCTQLPAASAHYELLQRALDPDPARRPTLSQVQEELGRWLAAIGQQPDGPVTERMPRPPAAPAVTPAWPTEERP